MAEIQDHAAPRVLTRDGFDIAERSHWLYCGVTESGKTTLARFHARRLADAKWPVIVYDPVRTGTTGGDWPSSAVLYTDPKIFLHEINKAKNAYVFVDESPDVFSHEMRENHWLLRRGRHRGLYLRLISTRPMMVHPNVRTQCKRVFMFRMSPSDAADIANDFGHDRYVVSKELDKGDCIMLEAGTPAIEHFNAFAVVN